MTEEVFAFPTSFAQQRLWFLDQLEPGDPAYNVPAVLRVEGALDLKAFERSFQEIVRRHESLRTTFAAVDGRPVQVVRPALNFSLPLIDLRDRPPAQRETEAMRLALEEAARPFDLARGPLMRVNLLRLGEEEFMLLLNLHHIVADGWSMGVLLNELSALYGAFAEGRPTPLPELPVQYADFAHWQREWLKGEVLQEQLSYWSRQLGGTLPVLGMRTDRPRPALKTTRGAKHPVALPKPLTDSLKELSQGEGVTLFMTLLTAFKVLLYRHTGQEDICVGSSIAGRNRAETEKLIGFFLNSLALRTDLSGNPTFLELLGRVKEVAFGAYAHQDIPVEMLLEALQPERNLSHNPLFQVMFIMQNTPTPNLRLGDLTLTPVHVESSTAKFDLTLDLSEGPDGVRGWLEYNTDLYEAETAARLCSHFLNLLRDIAARPSAPVGRLSLLPDDERRRLLRSWSRSRPTPPAAACLHHLFEAQARATPDALAVAAADASLSYAELDGRAGRLAARLRALGVGPESLVGVCMRRSASMVVALLGALKAGAAYVPLDPGYPGERLRQMVEDAGVRVVVGERGAAGWLAGAGARVLLLGEGGLPAGADAAEAGGGDESVESGVGPENLAYVIYTSGSTGKPKGVAVQHSSVVNYIQAAAAEYGMRPEDRSLQFASINFDASAEEIYSSLTTGGTLFLRTDEMLSTVATFLQTCADWSITVLNLPTAYWHEVVLRMSEEKLPFPESIRLVIIGGEKALAERLSAWHEHVPAGVRLMNTYGPTEATIVATMRELPPPAEGAGALTEIPIGRAVSNVETYVLDDLLEPVPTGAVGHLHLAGRALARGYLRRPALTAERFIPHPFSSEPGARLYRTGDAVRFLPGGELEYVGRFDRQVKVRGFRIELGEIEAALRQHPAVAEATTLVRDAAGDQRLVAYVVCRPGQQAGAGQLRAFLKERLPDYMVPAAYVTLDALPLTPSGKLDRDALPEPAWGGALEGGAGYAEPRTETERAVAQVWAEVLGLERVGVRDNFFELGGHSLLATQVISRIREALKFEVSLRNLFEFPTVAELAASIDATARAQNGLQRPPITPISRDGELPLSFAQERLWFLNQLDPESAAYHVLRPMRLVGRLDVELMERTFTEVMRRHEVYRTAFPSVQGRAVQVISPPQPVKLPIIDLTGLPEAERRERAEQLIMEQGRKLFDLSRGPLWRLLLVRLAEEEHLLILTEHHMVHDGWTEGALVQDFLTIYGAFADGRPSPLTELPVQYADFAYWQRQWLQGETLSTLLSYWKENLKDAPPLLQLPTDRPRAATQSFRGGVQDFHFSAELTRAINEVTQREGVTQFMLLLAAFKTLLFRYSEQDDIVISTSIANRNWIEIEKLTGFFVNTLLLRTDLSGDPTFRELLGRVREVSLAGYAHQDLPFEKLVEELQPERELSHQALFQIMFILQNAPRTSLELPGLAVELLHVHNGTAKFDILVSIVENEGELSGTFEYSTDLFDDSTIARMLGHFQTILESVVADAGQRISELPLLTGGERRQMLADWNDTDADYPADKFLHQLFEEQAALTPEATAVVFEDEELSYAELNERANRLAHYLRSLGAGPETLVGVCMERSAAMLVGVLGILKAGAAYVPLDPAFPKDRLTYILDDARVSLLLTQQSLADSLPRERFRCVDIDADWGAIARQSGVNPAAATAGDNAAYVIYTSGSTGRPKGVQIPHRAVVNFLSSMRREPGLTRQDVLLAVTTLSFDIAGLELYLPLTVGGKVVIASHEVASDGLLLSKAMARHDITVMQATPATWRLLLESGWRGTPLLKILCGGEALPKELAAELLQRGATLWNMYGPTETTIWSALDHVETAEAGVLIGRPIANTQIYLLDSRLNPVPAGVPGELHIGGDGLARGYLRRPGLTAGKFIPDPFCGEPGARLYKTGDLARYLPDGRIEYLGRLDHQVKVRGFRIEPGEVESVLAQHPAVRESVVAVHEEGPGEKRLVAYVVPDRQRDEEAEQSETAVRAEQVSQWEMAWDQAYSQRAPDDDPTFNISGWNSSYSGLPIPAEEMREWVDRTVERIRELRPSRVLEIGCGTGLLLFRLAPGCASYAGTDISRQAIGYITRQLAGIGLPPVDLRQRGADSLGEFGECTFDTVLLNSVIQYFPSVDYLLRVIEEAVKLVRAGGHIFIGDVRSLPLLEAFHASVQLRKAPASATKTQMRQSVQKNLAQEEELVIDPAFFYALKQHLPQISDVRIEVKRGLHHNELTRFRYDVVLEVGGGDAQALEAPWVDWQEQNLTVDGLAELLAREAPQSLGLRGVPSARLAEEVAFMQWLAGEGGAQTLAGLRKSLSKGAPTKGVDPEQLWALGERLPYAVEISWSQSGANGCYDVIFRRRAGDGTWPPRRAAFALGEAAGSPKPWRSYANDPLRGKFARKLVPQLRQLLKEKLPDYMVPSAFVMLPALPLTPNGKIDKRALPEPDRDRSEIQEVYTAPRTATEEAIASIWSEVLGVERVGIRDSFFGLGGHSLLATQVLSRVRETFQVEIPLRSLFATPTVEALAIAVIESNAGLAGDAEMAQILAELERLSETDAEALTAKGGD